jgi:nucleotide-binding universal stress UspA family protein
VNRNGPPTPDGDGTAPDSSTTRDALAKAVAEEEAKPRQLEVEQAEAKARLDSLRANLAVLGATGETRVKAKHGEPSGGGPLSPADKVRLFRQLFRGRPDVYPTRFVSKKTAKPGYAPACSNKFVRGVCELPKVKCGDCTRQAFRPVDDAAVLAHLKGQHVMGIYAMLDDETCWFLAVDFDKSNWIEDVRAFVETARQLGLPAVVERSRSGNGSTVLAKRGTRSSSTTTSSRSPTINSGLFSRRSNASTRRLSSGSHPRLPAREASSACASPTSRTRMKSHHGPASHRVSRAKCASRSHFRSACPQSSRSVCSSRRPGSRRRY